MVASLGSCKPGGTPLQSLRRVDAPRLLANLGLGVTQLTTDLHAYVPVTELNTNPVAEARHSRKHVEQPCTVVRRFYVNNRQSCSRFPLFRIFAMTGPNTSLITKSAKNTKKTNSFVWL
jgi:hypothetical protein